jgi:hypothetical protein
MDRQIAQSHCSVLDCEREIKGRGLCSLHYDRWRTHGDPNEVKTRKRIIVCVITSRGCWEWQGSRNQQGYANSGKGRVHRLVLAAKLGRPIKTGLHALHECDNPCCVNPDHLWEGTFSDNMKDMALKKRHFYPSGESNPSSKLTTEQVIAIRNRANRGEKQRRLAREYGISRTLVRLIKRGTAWAHLQESSQ